MTELSLAKYIVVVNVTTLLPKALKIPREAGSGTGKAWFTNHLKMLVSACHGLNVASASPPNSSVETLSSQCNGIGRWGLWEIIMII